MSQDLPTSSRVTAYALLGLLTFGDELTGYELKQRADKTLRFYWVAPAMSQIYSELARLTEHGLRRAGDDARRGAAHDGVPDHRRGPRGAARLDRPSRRSASRR